jgi:5-methylcytosine-specific restriction endonuclease McrA
MTYQDDAVQRVWEKATQIPDNDPSVWRQDQCKAWIGKREYGNRKSQYGWEIDHITPKSEGGSDVLSNLRPLQWENNASKQAGRLVCVVTSSGGNNVRA